MARPATHPDGLVTALFGDGSYLMLNSELYSAAFAGHPFVAVVCDNAGFAVIHRLQTGQGAAGFNNLLADSPRPGAAAACASTSPRTPGRSGALVEDVPEGRTVADLAAAYDRARAGGRAHPPAGGRGLPHPPLDVDRGGRVVGGRRAQRAVRPRGVRRAQGDPGAVAVMTRRMATRSLLVSRRGRPGPGGRSGSAVRCT